MKTYASSSRPGVYFVGLAGGGFKATFAVSKYKKWELLKFGLKVDKTKWNHFTFIVDDNSKLCVFINGVKEQCETSPISKDLVMTYNNQARIGGNWGISKQPGMYLDDFAIWLAVLTDAEVWSLYSQSKN